MRGYTKSGVSDAIREAGGALFAITSEPQHLAGEARDAWELDFSCVGDPHHEIVELCRERGWLSLFVNRSTDLVESFSAWAAHPKGYLQPGVLALSRQGRVLYRWRSRPTHKNIGGATGRPSASEVWRKIQDARRAPADDPDVAHDDPESLDAPPAPWPVFVLALLANGWFLRPRPFGLARAGPFDLPRRFLGAAVRGLGFLVAIAIAFMTLPAVWVVLALAVWAACITPGLLALQREFQNVPRGEPDRA